MQQNDYNIGDVVKISDGVEVIQDDEGFVELRSKGSGKKLYHSVTMGLSTYDKIHNSSIVDAIDQDNNDWVYLSVVIERRVGVRRERHVRIHKSMLELIRKAGKEKDICELLAFGNVL